jgi:predicted ATPase
MSTASDRFVRSLSLDEEIVEERGPGYPWSLPVVRALLDAGSLAFPRAVTMLVGENGSGKSTLLEALAVALGLNPEGGTEHFAFATRESHAPLHEAVRVVRGAKRPRMRFFLRAESLFTVATQLDSYEEGAERPFAAYGGRSLHEQSHGESFLSLVTHRFGREGLFLLDEPESALSPQGLLALLQRMLELEADGAQLIVATHSPILLALPGATIYELGEDGIRETAWGDTEHVRLTRAFLERPDAFLRQLGTE